MIDPAEYPPDLLAADALYWAARETGHERLVYPILGGRGCTCGWGPASPDPSEAGSQLAQHHASAGAAALEAVGLLPRGGAELAAHLGWGGPLANHYLDELAVMVTGVLARPP